MDARHSDPPASAPAWQPPADVTPEVAKILAFLRDRPGDKRWVGDMPVEAARARSRDLLHGFWNEHPPYVAVVRDAVIETPGQAIPVRIYDPESDGTRPIFFMHGGGFVVGDLDTHDGIPRRLALYSGRPVISIGYRRAPENPYPAPLDDCVAAVAAIAGGAVALGIDASRFALAGDSAGASLALGTAIRLRDENLPRAAAMALIFGCYDPATTSASIERFGNGQYLTSARDIRWYWQQYLGAAIDAPPLYAAPLAANLAGLPPAFIGVGGCDPLRDDSIRLAERLFDCGVPHLFDLWPGMVHGCVVMGRMLNAADRQLARIGVWLAEQLAA